MVWAENGKDVSTAKTESARPVVASPAAPEQAPLELRRRIDFWKLVFSQTSKNQMLLHDERYPWVIYKTLDFSGLDRNTYQGRKRIRRIEAREKQAIAKQLLGLSRAMRKGNPLSAKQQSLLAKFGELGGKSLYLDAAKRIRGQAGLKEKFERAIQRSGEYLPHMEKIFADAGLPLSLTRLPFVESSFNVGAYSRSAAAGIWQFIPGSARQFSLRMDDAFDARRDPLYATHAAAKHLKLDYKLLQDWPLAVTAYNYGRAGVLRATKKVGKPSLPKLIDEFKSRRFGFASQNFYAEFVAAVEVVEQRETWYPDAQPLSVLAFDEAKVADFIEFSSLAKAAQVSVEELSSLNPAYSKLVKSEKLLVEPNTPLRLPSGKKATFENGYRKLPKSAFFAEQRIYYRTHKVRKGEVLGSIARKYGTSIRAIARLNGLTNLNRLRIGKKLKIPPRKSQTGRPLVHQVRAGETLSGIARRYRSSIKKIALQNGLKPPYRLRVGQKLRISGRKIAKRKLSTHRVRPGETLSHIARRYRVSVARLKRANRLNNADQIRIGQRLVIPGS